MGGRCRRGVGRRETGGNPDPRTRPDPTASGGIFAAQRGCGRDRIRTCVGNAGDFTDRSAITLRVPSHPHLALTIAHDVRKWPVDSFGRPGVSPPVPPRPVRLSVGRSESGAKPPQAGPEPIDQVHRVGGAPHTADIAPPTHRRPCDRSARPWNANWKLARGRRNRSGSIDRSLRLSQKL
jgi:hypothetical protein